MSDKQYIASLSYGKDSMAMLHVITDVLHWQLDRIVTADVWATDTIPADLPPMVEFKKYADEEIKKRWGIEVEHFCARNQDGSKKTFEKLFYHIRASGNSKGQIAGFPILRLPECNGELKRPVFKRIDREVSNNIKYIGIAADEPLRFHNASETKKLPLVEAWWTEQMCRDWCEAEGLLAPIYSISKRDGCWFCIYQTIDQLRGVRSGYPELWRLLMKWDNDSPTTFRADGRTVHDIDRRLQWEDEGYKPTQKAFRWEDVEYPQMNIYQFIKPEPLRSFERDDE